MPFLTPEAPGKLLLVSLEIPDTMVPSVLGSMLAMDDPAHWESFGICSPEDVVILVSNILWSFQEIPFITGGSGMIVYTEDGNPSTILTDGAGNLIIATVRD